MRINIMTKETYLEMVKLIKTYEDNGFDYNKPYLETITITKAYNPNYGDDIECECGHPYYRHFDTYENMDPCGCKYCPCFHFKNLAQERDSIINKILDK
jgi:hypothetical protein